MKVNCAGLATPRSWGAIGDERFARRLLMSSAKRGRTPSVIETDAPPSADVSRAVDLSSRPDHFRGKSARPIGARFSLRQIPWAAIKIHEDVQHLLDKHHWPVGTLIDPAAWTLEALDMLMLLRPIVVVRDSGAGYRAIANFGLLPLLRRLGRPEVHVPALVAHRLQAHKRWFAIQVELLGWHGMHGRPDGIDARLMEICAAAASLSSRASGGNVLVDGTEQTFRAATGLPKLRSRRKVKPTEDDAPAEPDGD